MASPGKKVFLVGVGFIGWNILHNLVAEGYEVTGFVRRQEHGEKIKASGAKSFVLGDLNDRQKIADQASEHDITIHAATADHLPSAAAVLEGVSRRAQKGLKTIYIHTSGTSVLDDGAKGMKKSDKVYSDKTRSDVDSVPDDALHRPIDLHIIKAQKNLADKASIAIMIPPLIYGFNSKDARLSIQMPTLTRFALKHGYAGHVGKGLSVESNIHVVDLARAYLVLLHYMEQASSAEFVENPYFFCETTGDNEPSWREVASAIGEGLHEAGKIADPEPREFPKESYGQLFSDFTDAIVGLNSRSRAIRLREIGWKPVEKDWKRSLVEDELPAILKEDNSNFQGYAH